MEVPAVPGCCCGAPNAGAPPSTSQRQLLVPRTLKRDSPPNIPPAAGAGAPNPPPPNVVAGLAPNRPVEGAAVVLGAPNAVLVAPEECLYISVSPPSPRGEDAPPNENPELVAGTADERNMLPPLGVPKAGVAA